MSPGSAASRIVVCLALLFACGASAATERPAAGPEIPEAVILSALSGTAKASRAVDLYLTDGAATPQAVARRATALIRAIGGRKDGAAADALLAALDRVLGRAALALARTRVIRLGVDSGFIPSKGAIALDFGPAGAAAADGFERVAPDDPRISGKSLGSTGRRDRTGVLSDGVTGVERIELGVRSGTYRIVLMTQDLSDSTVPGTQFGHEVRINGVPLRINGPGPGRATAGAMLTRAGLSAANASGGDGKAAGSVSAPRAIRQGSALIVEAAANDGKLVIELRGFGRATSYLTGLLVEPRDRPSDLLLGAGIEKQVVPLELRLALESEILATAGEVIEALAPEAGRRLPGELLLPDPEFETPDRVSEN